MDGRVIEGESATDEFVVTGEAVPVEKTAGAQVIGGSVNQTGALVVETTRIGEDSFLFQVARHVEEAKAMKPGIVVSCGTGAEALRAYRALDRARRVVVLGPVAQLP